MKHLNGTAVYSAPVPSKHRDVVSGRNQPAMKVVRPPTGGLWYSVGAAADWLRQLSVPTHPDSPMLYQIDLTGVAPIVGVLDAYVGTFAREIKAGHFGEAGIVVTTQDPFVRHYVEMLAETEGLPIYLSESTTNYSIVQAKPLIPLTATERESLWAVMEEGGSVTAKQLAAQLEIGQTAAINRLNALVEKGLLYKIASPGRRSDVYVDRRAAAIQYGEQNLEATLADAASQ